MPELLSGVRTADSNIVYEPPTPTLPYERTAAEDTLPWKRTTGREAMSSASLHLVGDDVASDTDACRATTTPPLDNDCTCAWASEPPHWAHDADNVLLCNVNRYVSATFDPAPATQYQRDATTACGAARPKSPESDSGRETAPDSWTHAHAGDCACVSPCFEDKSRDNAESVKLRYPDVEDRCLTADSIPCGAQCSRHSSNQQSLPASLASVQPISAKIKQTTCETKGDWLSYPENVQDIRSKNNITSTCLDPSTKHNAPQITVDCNVTENSSVAPVHNRPSCKLPLSLAVHSPHTRVVSSPSPTSVNKVLPWRDSSWREALNSVDQTELGSPMCEADSLRPQLSMQSLRISEAESHHSEHVQIHPMIERAHRSHPEFHDLIDGSAPAVGGAYGSTLATCSSASLLAKLDVGCDSPEDCFQRVHMWLMNSYSSEDEAPSSPDEAPSGTEEAPSSTDQAPSGTDDNCVPNSKLHNELLIDNHSYHNPTSGPCKFFLHEDVGCQSNEPPDLIDSTDLTTSTNSAIINNSNNSLVHKTTEQLDSEVKHLSTSLSYGVDTMCIGSRVSDCKPPPCECPASSVDRRDSGVHTGSGEQRTFRLVQSDITTLDSDSVIHCP